MAVVKVGVGSEHRSEEVVQVVAHRRAVEAGVVVTTPTMVVVEVVVEER